MNNQSTNGENQKQQSITKHRPIRPDLLTKIYYPDTIYPTSYTFFTDRGSSSPMDSIDQHPTTETNRPLRYTATIPKHMSNEIEMTERLNRYSSSMLDRERGESDSERRRFDVKRYIPSALRAQDKNQPPTVLLDARFYSMKKTAMTIMCLLIIIMSNSVQLKHVLKQGHIHPFYGTQVTLGIVSVLMCTSIGFVQLYTFLFTQHDHLPLPSLSMTTLTRYDQLLILLPAILTTLLLIIDMIFFIMMF